MHICICKEEYLHLKKVNLDGRIKRNLQYEKQRVLTHLGHLISVQPKHITHKPQHLTALVSGGMKIAQVKILHQNPVSEVNRVRWYFTGTTLLKIFGSTYMWNMFPVQMCFGLTYPLCLRCCSGGSSVFSEPLPTSPVSHPLRNTNSYKFVYFVVFSHSLLSQLGL